MVSKIIVKSVSILSAMMVLLTFFSFAVSADTGKVFTMPLNQPTSFDCQGYIEYVVESPDYKFTPVTLCWRTTGDGDFDPSSVTLYYSFSSTNKLELFVSSPVSSPFYFSYFVVYGDCTTNYYVKTILPNDNTVTITLASGYKFYGFRPYGCYESLTYVSSYYPSMEFSFVYSQNAAEYELMLDYYELLYDLANNLVDLGVDSPVLEDIYSLLEDIANNTSTGGIIARRLLSIHNDLVAIESEVDQIEGYVDNVEPLLEEILYALNLGSDQEPPPPVDSSGSEDQMSIMDDYVAGSGSQNIQSDISDAFSGESLSGGLNSSASSFLWQVLQRFLDSSPKIFAMLMSLLSYGLISLLLGR